MHLHHTHLEALQKQGIKPFTKQACADCKPGDNRMTAEARRIQGISLNAITLQQDKPTSLDDAPATD